MTQEKAAEVGVMKVITEGIPPEKKVEVQISAADRMSCAWGCKLNCRVCPQRSTVINREAVFRRFSPIT